MEILRETEIEKELEVENTKIKEMLETEEYEKKSTNHFILNGNSNNSSLNELIDSLGIKVKLIFTSPPYNTDIDYDIYNDKESIDDYLDKTILPFIEQSDRLLDPAGRLIINIRDIKIGAGSRYPPIFFLYKELCEKRGYIYRGTHIWYKGREESSTAWGSWRSPVNPSIIDLYEYLHVFQKSGTFEKRKDLKYSIEKETFIESDIGVWKIRPVKKIFGKKKVNKMDHPCPFPEELAYRVIKLYSYPEDYVLDPFGGIGTTSLAAADSGRNSISVDLSSNYCDICKKEFDRRYNLQQYDDVKVTCIRKELI